MTAAAQTIHLFTTDSKPQRGGIAEYLSQLCEHAGAKGLIMNLHSTVPGSSNFPAKHYSIACLPARLPRELGKRTGDGFYFLRKWNTYRYYKNLERAAMADLQKIQGACDLAVVGYWSAESHFWCLACRKLRIPYAIVYHGAELLMHGKGTIQQWKKIDAEGARFLLANSDATGRLIQKTLGNQLSYTVIYPGVAKQDRPDLEINRLTALRGHLRIPNDAFVLLSVGRLIPRKGIDLALRAVASLKAEFPRLYYLILGDGPERSSLEALSRELHIESQTHFLGAVSDTDKHLYYALCDALILPTRTLNGLEWEGFGIVFLEAALACKPSIAGKGGGVAEAVADGKTGLVVETEDFHPTAEAVRRMITNDSERKQMGEAARERALIEFDWNRSAEEFVSCVRRGRES